MRLTPFLRLAQSPALLESLTIPAQAVPAAKSASNLPYLVSRTKSNRIPVYIRIGAGGSKKTTLIQRVEGDRMALRDEVREALGMGGADVVVNPTTGHVVVKGSHVPKLTEWLKNKGF
ncbi:uncharacterized protein DNG_02216 [Cephalotrichum gorgonifer]|uniref:Large ribosomal subunit protein mL49 n=1 Tax=Cephalotrichum gorgonifer TaxID=2041049 RepID=A0AAE8SSE6_9PEZI|nr:uncharacterized protein DNG_02216 [Cephalotrichum gorgonifer]